MTFAEVLAQVRELSQREGRVSYRALVRTKCEAIYFEPGGAQALVEAVNSVFALAKRNRQHGGKLARVI
ncbi:MAG: hypothetical protein AB1671_12150 [Thermodesulfobacteriota bacterium]